jgi:hypothetical protein
MTQTATTTTRIQNPITASNNARQLAARFWASKIYMAVNYGHWFRNTAHLEIETSEGLVDLSRAVHATRTSQKSRGADVRGGLLVDRRDWECETTEGQMIFQAKINLAQYEWHKAMNHSIDAWIIERIGKYLSRPPRYGSYQTGLLFVENPDYGSTHHTGERWATKYICEPDLEQRTYAAQLLAWMALEHRMPLGCLQFSEILLL